LVGCSLLFGLLMQSIETAGPFVDGPCIARVFLAVPMWQTGCSLLSGLHSSSVSCWPWCNSRVGSLT